MSTTLISGLVVLHFYFYFETRFSCTIFYSKLVVIWINFELYWFALIYINLNITRLQKSKCDQTKVVSYLTKMTKARGLNWFTKRSKYVWFRGK